MITMLERRPGMWRLRQEYRGPDGQRRFRYVTVRGTRRDAEVERARMLLAADAAREQGGEAPPVRGGQGITLRAWGERWLAEREAMGAYARTTLHVYQQVAERLYGVLGDRPIDEIRREDVIRAVAALSRQGLSPRTVRHTHTRLFALLREAQAQGLVARNAAAGVPLPRAPSEKGRALSQDEMSLLLAAARTSRLGPVVRFILSTGLRRGEVCGLRWQDVDLEAGSLRVARSIGQVGNCRGTWVKEPKTAASARTISLPRGVVQEMREMRAQRDAAYRELGADAGEMSVWVNDLGEMWTPGSLTAAVGRFLRAAGLRGMSLHDLRHAHATELLRARQNPRAVAARLGHTDPALVMRVYSHVMPDDDARLADAIEERMKG